MTNNNPEASTFILVPENTERYWDGYAVPCGFATEDGKRYQIVATRRAGATGRSDAQYILDRLASGLYFGKLQVRVPRAIPNEALMAAPSARWAQDEPVPVEVYDAAPEARGMVPCV
jgi:hypothetical protein